MARDAIGRATCIDCGRDGLEVRRQANGRLYVNCAGKGGCKMHHRFDPDIDNFEDLRALASAWRFRPLDRPEPASSADTSAPSEKPAHEPSPEPMPAAEETHALGGDDAWNPFGI